MQPILAASLSVPPAAFLAEALANAGTPGELLVRGLLDWEAARKDAYQLWFAALLLGTIIRVRHDEHTGAVGRPSGELTVRGKALCARSHPL